MSEKAATGDSNTSPTTTKHRGKMLVRAQAALSSLSRPFEDWGVSDVPILSSQITPRRSQLSHTGISQNSNGRHSDDNSSPKASRSGTPTIRPHVQSIRPLSIATVSTFGAWMPDQRTDDEVNGGLTESGDGIRPPTMRKLPVLASHDEAQHRTWKTEQHRRDLSPSRAPAPSELDVGSRYGLATDIQPLRMHPPSPSTSLPAQATFVQSQGVPPRPHTSDGFRSPFILNLKDIALKTNRTRCSRPTLAELNIDATINDAQAHSEVKTYGYARTDASRQSIPESIHNSLPRDNGYVEAMRLWYDEKETEALEAKVRERKIARRAGTVECAMANVYANHRL